MTSEELHLYWDPACKRLGLYPEEGRLVNLTAIFGTFEKLDSLLGTKHFYSWRRDTNSPLDSETIQLLQQLAGPHGKTVLRVYRIRAGLEQ